MVTVLRTNLFTHPFADGTTAGWSWTSNVSLASTNLMTPEGRAAWRMAITAVAAGDLQQRVDGAAPRVPVTSGRAYAASTTIRTTNSSRAARMQGYFLDANGSQVGTSVASENYAGAAWKRVSFVGVAPPGSVTLLIRLGAVNGVSQWQVGDVLDYGAVLTEEIAAVLPYFDGDTPDGPILPNGSRLIYDWTGTPGASASTESLTDAVISAELITSAGTPPPVQIVLNGIPNDAEYVVTGSTGAGSSWAVPGGRGIGDGGQIVLVDNRAALNTPVSYSVLVGGVTYTADPVTVVHDGQAVLQSLDGLTSVDFVWLSNSLPREPQINTVTFNVPGRRRPPVRYAPGGDGGGELLIRADRANNTAIGDLLQSGRPVLVRTDGTMRDWPAVELILLVGAPSRLWEAVEGGQLSTQRVWNLSFLYVDDPEPSRVLSAWTWDDFNQAALVSFPTWADFNALFAGQTWADFNTTAWGQYQ